MKERGVVVRNVIKPYRMINLVTLCHSLDFHITDRWRIDILRPASIPPLFIKIII